MSQPAKPRPQIATDADHGVQRSFTDFAAVSKRIAGRTTDLIAIGVVLIGGLTLGRQVVEWWHTEPPDAISAGASGSGANPWGSGDTPVQLEFGDYPLALRRQSVSGNRDAAMTALVAACRASVEGAKQPPRRGGAAVERLLAETASLEPVAENPGVWQVYCLEDRFALVVGVRTFVGDKAEDASPSRHVVCWGLAAPFNETTWTIYTFQPSSTTAGADDGSPGIPLPEDSRRILALRGEGGSGMIGFTGRGVPNVWIAFFTERLKAHGCSANGGWTSGPDVWSARFEPEQPGRRERIAIEFSRDATGALTGLILIDR